jgi:hypothetical protein
MARTAVVAGTASAVVGRVGAGQEAAMRREHQAAADREQLQEMQLQARVDAQVGEALGRHAAQAQAPAPAARSVDDLHAQLTKLGELRQAGLLTDDEFDRQKARLLG